MREMFSHLLVIGFVITVLCMLVYIAVQQNYRQAANDPQIQMAEDTAQALNQGQPLTLFSSPNKISIERSLAPFVVMYDKAGKPVAGNGQLAGQLPNLPQGVFNYASQNKEDIFTWQPEAEVRDAVVVTSYNNGFVMAGRSLREVEKREEHLTMYVTGAWITALVGAFATYYFAYFSLLLPTKRKK